MRFLIAPDKFKGSLDGRAVAENIAGGIRAVIPTAEIEIAPMADGGEGTAEIICDARSGEWLSCAAHDPLDRKIEARYAWLGVSEIAVMEMSEAAGGRRLKSDERAPLHANTFGVGELLLAAQQRNAHEVIMGLGGSVTNDGGFGMARALGFEFLAGDRKLTGGPEQLVDLTRIKLSRELTIKVTAAVDVQNPLLGEEGATRVFGAQKGATPAQIELLESALTKLAEVVKLEIGDDFRDFAGAGAAGGLGFALMSFCHAQVRPGFEVVAEATGFEEKIMRADVVITGEGKLDQQTLEGKTSAGVSKLARKHGKPVYAIVGTIADANAETRALFDSILELYRPPIIGPQAIKLAAQLLQERGTELAQRFFKVTG